VDPIFPSYLWDSDEETEQSPKTKKHERKAAILEDQEWKHEDNSVLLRLRKVTATRQLKADHSLTIKVTKPKYSRTEVQ